MLALDLILLTRDQAEQLVLAFRPKPLQSKKALFASNPGASLAIESIMDDVKSLDDLDNAIYNPNNED